MVLDLYIAREKYKPIGALVSIKLAVHAQLMALVMAMKPAVFPRMADYYEDAVIPVRELAAFAEEVGSILAVPDAPADVKDVAREIQSLAERAMREGLPIVVSAD